MPRNAVNQENLRALSAAITSGAVTGDFAPSVYVIEPTNRCNVNCVMCPNHKFGPDSLGDIPEELFTKIVDRVSPYAELVMLYFLGESTLHPSFVSLLRTARRQINGRIVVSTNALDLTPAVLDVLVENADIVIVCIDRWNAAAYEAIRRGSRFTSVVATAEALLERRGSRESPVVIVKGLDIALPSEPAADRETEATEFAAYWRERGAVPLVGWLNTWAGQMANLAKLARGDTPYTDRPRGACADLWFKMVINWRGEVVLCCHDWSSSQVMGSLASQSIAEVWHSKDLIGLRERHIVGAFASNVLCGGCREWGEADELEAYVRLSEADLYKVF